MRITGSFCTDAIYAKHVNPSAGSARWQSFAASARKPYCPEVYHLFNPSQEEVRRFFCGTWRKHCSGALLSALEAMALDAIQLHPEYHDLLGDEEAAVQATFSVDRGQTNPFLHLSMHLAISEQISIDQPPGITTIFQQLLGQHGTHSAAHGIMESLGEVLWEAQQKGTPPNTEQYLELMKRRLGRT